METFNQALTADWTITCPFILIFLASTSLDIIFGLAAAFAKLTMASKVNALGVFKKLLKFLTILVAALFDGVLPTIETTIFGQHIVITIAGVACVWWIVCEWLSITEKAAILGMPMPARLRDALAQVKAQIDIEDPKTVALPNQPPPKPIEPNASEDQV